MNDNYNTPDISTAEYVSEEMDYEHIYRKDELWNNYYTNLASDYFEDEAIRARTESVIIKR